MSFYYLQEEEPEKKNLKLRGQLLYGHKRVEMVVKASAMEMFVALKQFVFY